MACKGREESCTTTQQFYIQVCRGLFHAELLGIKQETLLLVNQTLLFLALSLTSVQTVTKKNLNIQCLHKIEHNLSHRDSLNLRNYHSCVPIE